MTQIFDSTPGHNRPPFVINALTAPMTPDPDFAGFSSAVLHEDPATGDRTVLMRVEPNAYAGTHSHEQVEHIYVLEGTFSDEYGDYGPGDYVRRDPRDDHESRSSEGALVLLLYTRP